MEKIINYRDSVLSILDSYWAGSTLQILFYIACIVIIVREKDKLKKNLFVYYSLLIIVIIVNPLTNIVMTKFFNTGVGGNYYNRLFFIVPFAIVTAYGFTKLINNQKHVIKLCSFLLMIGCIYISTRQTTYTALGFTKAENFGHIPEDVFQIREIINDDSKDISMLVPSGLACYMEQLEDGIHLVDTRDTIGSQTYNLINTDVVNFKSLRYYVKTGHIQYIVAIKNDDNRKNAVKYKYEVLGDTNNYIVIKTNVDEK